MFFKFFNMNKTKKEDIKKAIYIKFLKWVINFSSNHWKNINYYEILKLN